MVFPVVTYGCESWTVKKAEHWRIDAFFFFNFIYLFIYFYFTILYWFCHTSTCIRHGCTCVPHPWTVVLEKTLASPLDCKEIQPAHPKGDQSWVFIGRTNAKANSNTLATSCEELTHWKRPWCWGQKEKGKTEDEMAGWHNWLDRHEFG